MRSHEIVLGNRWAAGWRASSIPGLQNVCVVNDELQGERSATWMRDPFEEYFDIGTRSKDHKLPHLVFSGLRETSDHLEMVQFHKQYGPLYTSGFSSPEAYVDTENSVRFRVERYRVSIQKCWEDQRRFRSLMNLWSLLRNCPSGTASLRSLMIEIVPFLWASGNFLEDTLDDWWMNGGELDIPEWVRTAPKSLLWSHAASLFEMSINKEWAQRCSDPRLINAGEPGHFRISMAAPDLLGALYGMLALDAANGVNIGYCANDRCRKPFFRDKADKVYCGRACANRVSVRRHYHRQKHSRKKQKTLQPTIRT